MNRTKSVVRFLFTPRTNSPTVAYYSGFIGGAALAYYVLCLIEVIREEREWQESELGKALKETHDKLNAFTYPPED